MRVLACVAGVALMLVGCGTIPSADQADPQFGTSELLENGSPPGQFPPGQKNQKPPKHTPADF